MTSPFTCITCRVAFQDLELQRQHYKSDWHRYNLKKKVAELPPVTADEFQKRVIAQRSKAVDEARSASSDSQNLHCKICRRKFSTTNQFDNHLISKKHKINSDKYSSDNTVLSRNIDSANDDNRSRLDNSVVANNKNKAVSTLDYKSSTSVEDEIEIDTDVESVDSDKWIEDTENPVENNDCLFCNHHSRSLIRNLKHMTVAHSFFIPDAEYCIDIKGLLTYLGKKIFAEYMCIWCNNLGKTFQSVDAVRAHMLDKGHCKMLHEGEALIEYTEFYDYSSSYPADADINCDPDEEIEAPIELDNDDYRLVLPSGNVIGHRSLLRYYKQSLNPNKVIVPKNDKIRDVLRLQYQTLGWIGARKEAAVKKARDIKYMQRIQAKYSTQLQFKTFELRQRYFRKQVNF